MSRVILASFLGTTIEWYDFFLYGTAAALVFNKLFFPTFDPLAGTVAAFASFAIGFLARPLGGIIFGHYGDKIGRKSMLVLTLALMGLATFAIGLLPTYASIGALAPLLLTLLRFVQGLGVGGEWGGAVLLALEHGHAGKRGFYASWPQAGVPMGLLLATGIFNLVARLPDAQFLAWGWRLPFLLGVVLVVVGLFIRLRIAETPLFSQVQEERNVARLPVLEVLRTYPRNILIGLGARVAGDVSFYIYSVFVLTYGTQKLGIPRDLVLKAVLLASAIELFTIPAFALASDRFGRRPVCLFGALFSMLWAFPFFGLMDTKKESLIFLGVALGLSLGHAAMYGPLAAFLSELFGTRVRYSGASLGYQLASPLAGGLAPLVATLLLARSGGGAPVAWYMILMDLISLLAFYLALESFQTDLSHELPGIQHGELC